MPQLKKSLALRLFVGAVILMWSAASALAQQPNKDDYPKVEVFVGYSALGEANSRGIAFGAGRTEGYYSGDGIETSVIRNFSKHFGMKGDFSAHFNNNTGRGPLTSCTSTPTCTTVPPGFRIKPRTYNFL